MRSAQPTRFFNRIPAKAKSDLRLFAGAHIWALTHAKPLEPAFLGGIKIFAVLIAYADSCTRPYELRANPN